MDAASLLNLEIECCGGTAGLVCPCNVDDRPADSDDGLLQLTGKGLEILRDSELDVDGLGGG